MIPAPCFLLPAPFSLLPSLCPLPAQRNKRRRRADFESCEKEGEQSPRRTYVIAGKLTPADAVPARDFTYTFSPLFIHYRRIGKMAFRFKRGWNGVIKILFLHLFNIFFIQSLKYFPFFSIN